MCTVTAVTIVSMFNIIQGYLPSRIWLPYDTNIAVLFWITSVQQIVSVIFATIINVATETLISGLILQTCAQIEIFQNRLQKLIISKTITHMKHSLASSNTRSSLFSEYIRHHLGIYELVMSKSILLHNNDWYVFIYKYQLLTCEIAFVTCNIKLTQDIIADMPKH
jgi:hypothetical protein